MASKITSSNYANINTAITDFTKTGKYIGVGMTIFNNEGKTEIHNSIQNRIVKGVILGNSYINEAGVTVKPSITVTFSDSTSFKAIDDETNAWYSLEPKPLVKRTF